MHAIMWIHVKVKSKVDWYQAFFPILTDWVFKGGLFSKDMLLLCKVGKISEGVFNLAPSSKKPFTEYYTLKAPFQKAFQLITWTVLHSNTFIRNIVMRGQPELNRSLWVTQLSLFKLLLIQNFMNIDGTTFFLNYSLPLAKTSSKPYLLYCLTLDELDWLTPQDFVLIQYIYVLNFKCLPMSGYTRLLTD